MLYDVLVKSARNVIRREARPMFVLIGVVLLAATALGCGGGDQVADAGGDGDLSSPDGDVVSDADRDESSHADADAERDTSHCDGLTEGWNEGFPVDELERGFILDLPEEVESGGPWPVVFAWHGLYQAADEMSDVLVDVVDNDRMPFIGVSPEDTNYDLLGWVVDWDVALVTPDNREARLFDEVLFCLDHLYGVDRDRVHSVGVSMGGFVTDMLGTIRGEELASLVSFSGGYGSNTENLEGTLELAVRWPDHDLDNKYVQLIAHGGRGDALDLDVFYIDFYLFALSDAVFLNERGHDVILCDHGLGHWVPEELVGTALVDFFADHPRGTAPSPYAEGFPDSFPDYCRHYGAR